MSAHPTPVLRNCLLLLAAGALLAFLPLAVPAGDSPAGRPPVFAALEGHWTGEGQLMGRPAEFAMHWESEGAFVRLTFGNTWVGEDGARTPVLSAAAVYYPRDASAVGVWLDDRPQRVLLEAVLTDSTVTTTWTADSEQGRTEYRVLSPDAVIVRDFVRTADTERLFGEATYRRTTP